MIFKIPKKRNGLKDIWNAFMVENAVFSQNDIPLCPTTATNIPNALIGYDEAKKIHKQMMKKGNKNYHINAFIHFYIDDSKFDGKRTSIWLYPSVALRIIKHFDGIISPDFSTYADFPDPIKRKNYYRMNAFGYWVGSLGYSVISNLRWDCINPTGYCLDGIPHNSMLCLGAVASSLKYGVTYDLFAQQLIEVIEILTPTILIVNGSINYPCFDEVRKMGVNVISFPGRTQQYYERRKRNEQK